MVQSSQPINQQALMSIIIREKDLTHEIYDSAVVSTQTYVRKKNILEYTKLQQNQTTTFQLSQPLYVKITQLKLD